MITIAERKRALKLPDITEEMWNQIKDEEYKSYVDEFLDYLMDRSAQTKKQYRSALRQFGWYKHLNLKDKRVCNLIKRDMVKYLAYLKSDRMMSTNGINLKKSALSSFFNFIELIISDSEEDYRAFKNLLRNMPVLNKNTVYEKEKITFEEYEYLLSELKKRGNALGVCWLTTAFFTGARRGEIIQFKTSILDKPFPYEKGKAARIKAHKVRGKGRGEEGKENQYHIFREVYEAMKDFVENRGYENEYIFTTGTPENNRQISLSWANDFCQRTLSEILHRRINPHIFKASCITYMYEVRKLPLDFISKQIAMHESIDLTRSRYLLVNEEEEADRVLDQMEID